MLKFVQNKKKLDLGPKCIIFGILGCNFEKTIAIFPINSPKSVKKQSSVQN